MIERCRIERPDLRAIEPGRRSACHRAEEVGTHLIESLAKNLSGARNPLPPSALPTAKS
jgi:hypothetical protein